MEHKKFYARQFGLPVEQVKFFGELSDFQKSEVRRLFGINRPGDYMYAVKRDGDLVWERKKRDFLREQR